MELQPTSLGGFQSRYLVGAVSVGAPDQGIPVDQAHVGGISAAKIKAADPALVTLLQRVGGAFGHQFLQELRGALDKGQHIGFLMDQKHVPREVGKLAAWAVSQVDGLGNPSKPDKHDSLQAERGLRRAETLRAMQSSGPVTDTGKAAYVQTSAGSGPPSPPDQPVLIRYQEAGQAKPSEMWVNADKHAALASATQGMLAGEKREILLPAGTGTEPTRASVAMLGWGEQALVGKSLFELAESGTVQKTPGGVHYAVLQPGTGQPAVPGENLKVAYTGTAIGGARLRGVVEFQLGDPNVMSGFTEGLTGAQVGEKRRLIIPSELAYGGREVGHGVAAIERNSTLDVTVEVMDRSSGPAPGGKGHADPDPPGESWSHISPSERDAMGIVTHGWFLTHFGIAPNLPFL